MNIVEKYIDVNKQFVIFISGLPGCGKQELGAFIARDLKFTLLNEYDYYKKNYDEKITLKDEEGNELELINWFTDMAIDWDKLNMDINKYKNEGVVVIGMSLPKDRITSVVDFHIHLNISKQVSMEKFRDYVELNKDKYPEMFDIIGTPMEKLQMNKLIYPYYLETTKLALINKYITVKEMNHDEVYDMAFDILMAFVQKSLDDITGNVDKKVNKKEYVKKEKVNVENKKNMNTDIILELLDEPKYSYDDEIDMVKKYDDTSDDDSSDEDDMDNITSDDLSSVSEN